MGAASSSPEEEKEPPVSFKQACAALLGYMDADGNAQEDVEPALHAVDAVLREVYKKQQSITEEGVAEALGRLRVGTPSEAAPSEASWAAAPSAASWLAAARAAAATTRGPDRSIQ